MDSIDEVHDEQPLWHAALRSALGPLAAYLTPENYGLSAVSLSALQSADDEFQAEIDKRLDLARALQVIEIIETIGSDLPQSYRHYVHYCEDRIDGALLIPRLVQERTAGRHKRIPVLRASRFKETPEALLVSESIRISSRIASAWRNRGGAEGKLAGGLAHRLAAMEARQPWASLKSKSRPALTSLAATVKSRTIAGWNARGAPLDRLTDAMLDGSKAVTEAAGPIFYLVSKDPRFEDRLFELICLGWLLGALKAWDPSGTIYPKYLRASGAIFTGGKQNLQVKLFYQAGHISQSARYFRRGTSKPLRAIPDFLLSLNRGGRSMSVLLDAKNRVLSSNSEILYKMLGYRENLGMSPYFGLGIAPAYDGNRNLDSVRYSQRLAAVLQLPLNGGADFVKRVLPLWLARFEQFIDEPQFEGDPSSSFGEDGNGPGATRFGP